MSREMKQALRESMRPTALDRMIATVAPGWGLRRMQSRAVMAMGAGLLGGYAGAWAGARKDVPGLENFNAHGSSPDEEQIFDRDTLIARSDDLERNDALAGGAIAELVTSVVGTGLSCHPEPSRKILGWNQDQAAEWAQEVKERFLLWAENPCECDAARRRDFYQAQAIAYRTMNSKGDVFALMPRLSHPGTTHALKFQMVEGTRVMSPPEVQASERFNQGIETDEYGGELRYHFAKRYPTLGSVLRKEDFVAVDVWGKDGRRQALHLFRESRLDVRRGYPLLSPIIATLKQLSRLTEAELSAAVVTSFFAVMIEKPNGASMSPFGGVTQTDSSGQSTTELGPCLMGDLSPGEKMTQVAPVRPNGAFDPFWRSLVGQLSLRIQVPPEVLLKKYESSYTAARGALLQFWKFVTTERDMLLAPLFCQPLYEAWLAEDVAAGRTKAPGFFRNALLRSAYSQAKWVGDNPPILDPLKEVLAAEELITFGLSTYDEQTMRLTGGSFEPNVEKLSRETRLREEAGLVAMPQPKGKAASAPAPDPEDVGEGDSTSEDAPKDQEGDQDEAQTGATRSARRSALLAYLRRTE